MSIFKNYELRLAGEIQCKDINEALRLASDYFMTWPDFVQIERKEIRPEGTVIEMLDERDGAQENPFFCIVTK